MNFSFSHIFISGYLTNNTQSIDELKSNVNKNRRKLDKTADLATKNTQKLDICQQHLKKVGILEGSVKLSEGRTRANLDNFLTKMEKQAEEFQIYGADLGRLREDLYEEKK